MKTLTIAKFGGSALGTNGSSIPNVIKRIKEMLKDEKVLTVFSAPLAIYDGKTISITDIGLQIGKNHAKSNPVDIKILREVYQEIASKYMNEIYRKEFLPIFDDYDVLVFSDTRYFFRIHFDVTDGRMDHPEKAAHR